jgi:hypothetical protein
MSADAVPLTWNQEQAMLDLTTNEVRQRSSDERTTTDTGIEHHLFVFAGVIEVCATARPSSQSAYCYAVSDDLDVRR